MLNTLAEVDKGPESYRQLRDKLLVKTLYYTGVTIIVIGNFVGGISPAGNIAAEIFFVFSLTFDQTVTLPRDIKV